MYLIKFAGVFVVAAGANLAASTLHAEQLMFSYLDPSTDEVVATTAAATPRPAPADAPSAPSEPELAAKAAVGTWTTAVTRAPTPAAGPMAKVGAAGKDRLVADTAPPGPRLTGTGHSLSGIASYYWQDQMTATGERFNKRDLTAAHKTLPFGTRVRVTRLDNGANVVVRINDRGPFTPGRVIDLSERAAEDIGMTGKGLTAVRLEVLGR